MHACRSVNKLTVAGNPNSGKTLDPAQNVYSGLLEQSCLLFLSAKI
jgi:hypothetical protein